MQYRFRLERSTIDDILEMAEAVKSVEAKHFSHRVEHLVTLNVRNAFNSARLCDMMEVLDQLFRSSAYLLGILEDYVRDRAPVDSTREGQRKMIVTSGAA